MYGIAKIREFGACTPVFGRPAPLTALVPN
jgi:hypothetical protein